jgi:diaminohydroxyphosphoribosylaminopyrimidine deaminase/5-amino-6-(5-phosphoribosylamino)uracil reductase
MSFDDNMMRRCLELAQLGLGHVAPNPMVGCVITYNDKIIGEGYHEVLGGAHAEVNAIKNVKDKSLLSKGRLYVNLEPCCHTGRTPPCTDQLIRHGIPEVIIGCTDTSAKVNGRGIEVLQKAKSNVRILSSMEKECREMNCRFFTNTEKNRPYIILKWAESADALIGNHKVTSPVKISNNFSQMLTHKWRSEEPAIMVGTTTALVDNPHLTNRLWNGKNPVRIVLDRDLKIPKSHNLLNMESNTIIFTEKEHVAFDRNSYVKIDFDNNLLPKLLLFLHQESLSSVIVEGGSHLLNEFIKHNLWDEARVFKSDAYLHEGVPAPLLPGNSFYSTFIHNDRLVLYKNNSST